MIGKIGATSPIIQAAQHGQNRNAIANEDPRSQGQVAKELSHAKQVAATEQSSHPQSSFTRQENPNQSTDTYQKPVPKETGSAEASIDPSKQSDPSTDAAVATHAKSTDDGSVNKEKTQTSNGRELDTQQIQQVQELKTRDREVRQHEQAHLAAAGQHAKGGPSFTFQQGPDGKRYAVGGEVQIDTSPVANDPQATIQKAQQIQAAASAPAEPSSQDRKVAAQAAQMASQARVELAQQVIEERKQTTQAKEQKTEDTKSTPREPVTNEGAGNSNTTVEKTKSHSSHAQQQAAVAYDNTQHNSANSRSNSVNITV